MRTSQSPTSSRAAARRRCAVAIAAVALFGCGSNLPAGGGYGAFGMLDAAAAPCVDPLADGGGGGADGNTAADSGGANGDGPTVIIAADASPHDVPAGDTAASDTGPTSDDAAALDAAADDTGLLQPETLDDAGANDAGIVDASSVDASSVDAATAPPTFGDVYTNVLSKYGCTSSLCHGAKSGALGYFTDSKLAYDLLVNKASKVESCQFLPLVLPGKPETSVLYTKVKTGIVTCGNKMPIGSQGLPEAAAKLIHDWIQAGAPK